MNSEPYNEWIRLYNQNVEFIWHAQCTELRNAAMLLKILDNEFKRIYKNVEEKIKVCGKIVHTKPEVFVKDYANDEKENISLNQSSVDSPEVFLHSSFLEPNSTDIEKDAVLMPSQENYCTSPKINRTNKVSRLKRFKQDKAVNRSSLKMSNVVQKNKQADIIDSTILETPKPTKHKSVGKISKRKPKLINSTLTQMFSDFPNTTKDSETDAGLEITERTKIFANSSNQEFNKIIESRTKEQSEGWDCSDCKAFYGALDLNSGEAKRLLNKCSKHRSKFKQHNYTPKGFWDLDFPLTQASEKNSSDSTYFQY